MSTNVQQRQQPGNQRRAQLGAKQIAWRAAVFRERGWQSKTVEQTALFVDMARTTKEYEDGVFQPGGAKALRDRNLDPGKEFKNYLATLERFESIQPPRPNGEVDALRSAAQAYIDHYAQHSKRQRAQPKNIAKRDACQKTLLDLTKYDQLAELKKIGAPPWDPETGMRAASLKTTLDFESLPPGKDEAEALNGQNANTAFWFNKPGQDGEPEKSFLFKPDTDRQSDIRGFPDGAETMREAMTGRTADLLTGMTGIKFDVPETHVIKVDPSRFPPGSLDALPDNMRDQPVLGSLQQFAKTDGEMRDNDLSKLGGVPAEDCQKIGILDIVTMNMDRHAGNLMFTGDEPNLVPIDHGLTFPPQAAVGEIATRMGTEQNALLSIPGAHEKFSPEMLDAIDKLDPRVVTAGLKSERETLDKVHGGCSAKIPDDALAISARSTQFLKLAARELSPAAVQIALAQNAKALLDPAIDGNEFARRARAAIGKAKANQDSWAAYFTLPKERQAAIQEKLAANGWPSDRGVVMKSWLVNNMDLAMKAYAADMVNPGLYSELEQKIGKQALDRALQTHPIVYLVTRVAEFRPQSDEDAPRQDAPPPLGDTSRDLPALHNAFPKAGNIDPNTTRGEQTVRDWRAFVAKGGMNELERAIAALGLTGIDEQNARADPSSALKAVRLGEHQDEFDETDLDDADLDARLVSDALVYARDLALLLSNAERVKALRVISRYEQQLATNKNNPPTRDAVEKVQLATLDLVRKELRNALDDLVEDMSPDQRDQTANNVTGLRGDIAQGTVKTVRTQVDGLRQQLNL